MSAIEGMILTQSVCVYVNYSVLAQLPLFLGMWNEVCLSIMQITKNLLFYGMMLLGEELIAKKTMREAASTLKHFHLYKIKILIQQLQEKKS